MSRIELTNLYNTLRGRLHWVCDVTLFVVIHSLMSPYSWITFCVIWQRFYLEKCGPYRCRKSWMYAFGHDDMPVNLW